MEMLHHTLSANSVRENRTTTTQNWLNKMEAQSEFNRYGIISVGFLLIGILGGITIAISAYAHLWQITVIALFTMLSLSLMLAVAPMKYILRVTAVTLLLDLLILMLNAVL
jgi:hypothetical protein